MKRRVLALLLGVPRKRHWRLRVRVTDEDGGWEACYDDSNVSSPQFAAGFVSGYAYARGIPPEQIHWSWEVGS